MQRRPLGTSGQMVSEIGLGCMGMSEFYGPSDEAQSLDALAAALDHRIDFFDTADTYGAGHNEELIGRFSFVDIGGPSSSQAAILESQTIHPIQHVSERTLIECAP